MCLRDENRIYFQKSDSSQHINYYAGAFIDYITQNMKDKFTIFSPPASKVDSFQGAMAFKKSPNKFAVYEPFIKPKDTTNFPPNQSLSSKNLENLRKLPSEYSTLRQTLNFKPSNFESWMQEGDKEKAQKPSNILRQTLSNKSSFRPKTDKNFSQTIGVANTQSSTDLFQKPMPQQELPYSRKGNYVPETKSLRSIDYDSHEQSIEQLREKWKAGGFKSPVTDNKRQKLLEQLEELKKLSTSRVKEEQQHKHNLNIDRKFSNPVRQQHEDANVFRKKTHAQETYQCYTPKLPKYSYDDRFKKVGSPTSTNNSDSRSPPTKFIEIQEQKKKTAKLSFQDFEVGKTLGEGKFGVVMIARHRKTASLFALKKIPKQMIKSHMMIDQLALQIRLQSCLSHKNILGIYGFFDNSTHLFIVLQYMQQGTLYSQLKKNKILPEHEAATIIKQITSAVEYLHDHDVAHRDIKPQNIVISNNVCKLCDFGWATICDQRRKTYCGTFDYAAPEILEGKEYDMSVDLWCLGVLTYQLLAGKAPFYHLSRKETMRKIINCQHQTVTYPQSMSAQAIDFIERLIRKNPEERMKASDALKHKFLTQIEE